jgi:hypothetical protein
VNIIPAGFRVLVEMDGINHLVIGFGFMLPRLKKNCTQRRGGVAEVTA